MDAQQQQQIWDYVYGLLPDDEVEAVENAICSDPEMARAYAEVRLQTNLLRRASIVVEPKIEWSEPDQVTTSTKDRAPSITTGTGYRRWANWTVAAAAVLVVAATFFGRMDSSSGRNASMEVASVQAPQHYAELTTPAVLSHGVSNTIAVRGFDAKTDENASIDFRYRLLDENLRVRYASDSLRTPKRGLSLQTPPLPDSARFLEVAMEGGPALRAPIDTAEDPLVARVVPDKPVYEAGDTVRFRVQTLTRFKREPGADVAASARLKDALGETLAETQVDTGKSGVAVGEIPTPQAGGPYTLEVEDAEGRFLAAKAPVHVRDAGPAAGIDFDLEFAQDSYKPGETVVADLSIGREGRPLENARVKAFADIDGQRNEVQSTVVGSQAQLMFALPEDVRDVARMRVEVAENESQVPQSLVKSIPLGLKEPKVAFLPEGGLLLENRANRVFFIATDDADQPVHLRGNIISDLGDEVADVEVQQAGRGWFAFTPQPDRVYALRVDSRLIPVPTASPEGIAIYADPAVFEADAPVSFRAIASDPDVEYMAIAECRGVAVGQRHWMSTASQEGDAVTIEIPKSVGGVIRLTVLQQRDSQWEPLAERLVYRHSPERLQIDLEAASESVSSGVSTLIVRDESGRPVQATLGAQSAPLTAFQQVRKQAPAIETYFNLLGDLRDVEDLSDANLALQESDPQSGPFLELLLGADGWRRFANPEFADSNGEANWNLESEPYSPPVTHSNREAVRSYQSRAERMVASGLPVFRYLAIAACLVGIFVILLMGLLRVADTRAWAPALATSLAVIFVSVNMQQSQPDTVAMQTADDTNENVDSVSPASAEIESPETLELLERSADTVEQLDAAPATAFQGVAVEGAAESAKELDATAGGSGAAKGAIPAKPTVASADIPQAEKPADKLDARKLASEENAGGKTRGGRALRVRQQAQSAPSESTAPSAPAADNASPKIARAEGLKKDSDERQDASEDKIQRKSPPLKMLADQGQRARSAKATAALENAGGEAKSQATYAKDKKGEDREGGARQSAARDSESERRSDLVRQELVEATRERVLSKRFFLRRSPGRTIQGDVETDSIWQPVLRADADGKSQLAVPELRVSQKLVVDAFGRGRLGQSEFLLAPRSTYYAEAVAPRSITSGDSFQLPIDLRKGDIDSVELEVEVTASGVLRVDSPESKKTVRLDADNPAETVYVQVSSRATSGSGEVLTQISASGDVEQLRRTVVVQPRGYRIESTQSGLLADATNWRVELPEDAHSEISLKVYPSVAAELQDALATTTWGAMLEPDAAEALSDLSLRYLATRRVPQLTVTRAAKRNRSNSASESRRLTERKQAIAAANTPDDNESADEPARSRGLGSEELQKNANMDANNLLSLAKRYAPKSLEEYAKNAPEANEDASRAREAVVGKLGLNTGKLKDSQRADGRVGDGVEAVTSTAVAASEWWYSTSYDDARVRALNWLNSRRQPSGGFGSPSNDFFAMQAFVQNDKTLHRVEPGATLEVLRDNQTVATKSVVNNGVVQVDELEKFAQPGDNTFRLQLGEGNRAPFVGRLQTWLPAAPKAETALRMETQLNALETRRGETVELRTVIANGGDSEASHVTVEIGLPGGLRSRVERLDELVQGREVDAYETRPGFIFLHWRNLQAGARKTLVMDLNAAVPGQFEGPASAIYERTRGSQRAFAAPLQITVD